MPPLLSLSFCSCRPAWSLHDITTTPRPCLRLRRRGSGGETQQPITLQLGHQQPVQVQYQLWKAEVMMGEGNSGVVASFDIDLQQDQLCSALLQQEGVWFIANGTTNNNNNKPAFEVRITASDTKNNVGLPLPPLISPSATVMKRSQSSQKLAIDNTITIPSLTHKTTTLRFDHVTYTDVVEKDNASFVWIIATISSPHQQQRLQHKATPSFKAAPGEVFSLDQVSFTHTHDYKDAIVTIQVMASPTRPPRHMHIQQQELGLGPATAYMFGADTISTDDTIDFLKGYFEIPLVDDTIHRYDFVSPTNSTLQLTVEINTCDVPIPVKDTILTTTSINMSFGISVGYCGGGSEDVLFASLTNVKAYIAMYEDNRHVVDVAIQSFQIDDQSSSAVFPVIVSPCCNHPSTPAFMFSVVDAPSHVHAKHMRTLQLVRSFLMESNIKLSETFLQSLQLWLNRIHDDDVPPVNITTPPQSEQQQQQQLILIERLDFMPIRLNLTFHVTAVENLAELTKRYPAVAALTTAVAAISDAPLRLNSIRLFNESFSMNSLIEVVTLHYRSQITMALLSVAGSVDVLGSPVHLIDSIGSGAFSFFFEPAIALSKGGASQVVTSGFKRGVTQAAELVAGASLDSFSKFCFAVSAALKKLESRDKNFAKMVQRVRQDLDGGVLEPINLWEGVVQGTSMFARSVVNGLLGLLTGMSPFHSQPYSALNGILAALLRPTSGLLDALAALSIAARNSLTIPVAGTTASFRLRLPRERSDVTGGGGLLLPYSPRRAVGMYLATQRFVNSSSPVTYVAHEHVLWNDHVHVLLLTTQWVLAIRQTCRYDSWAIPMTFLHRVEFVANVPGLVLEMKEGLNHTASASFTVYFSNHQRVREFMYLLQHVMTMTTVTPSLPPPPQLVHEASMTTVTIPRNGTELDILNMHIETARIISSGISVEDGVIRYCIQSAARGGSGEVASWAVYRRYNDFLAFREKACLFLHCSRRLLPLPPKKPWSLSFAETEARLSALQDMLDRVVTIDLLSESEELKTFLMIDARNIMIGSSTL